MDKVTIGGNVCAGYTDLLNELVDEFRDVLAAKTPKIYKYNQGHEIEPNVIFNQAEFDTRVNNSLPQVGECSEITVDDNAVLFDNGDRYLRVTARGTLRANLSQTDSYVVQIPPAVAKYIVKTMYRTALSKVK